jgi:NADH-quinone oxidoreductase subunit I
MSNYFKNIYVTISTILIGMRITISHLFYKNVTVQYPNVHPLDKAGSDKMPANARNRIFNDYEDCNGCMGCMRACPVNCITVETLKTTPGDDIPMLRSGGKRGLWVTKWDIDFAKCCFCSLCTEPCPTNSIRMTPDFEYSVYDRSELLYHFSKMTPEEIQSKKDMLAKYQAEKKKAEDAKKAEEAKNAEQSS